MKLLETYKNKNLGTSSIELLIILAILGIIFAGIGPLLNNLQVSTQTNKSTEIIIQFLRLAKEKSFSRINNQSHGVYFNITASDDSIILFQGNDYSTRDAQYDREYFFSSSISLATSLAGNEVVFSKGLSRPNIVSTEDTVTVSHDVFGSRIVTINSYGLIDG